MLKIKYKIKEYNNQIFVVIVPNRYVRAMLFLRIQEFYESKSRMFRNKRFSFWSYKEWYSRQNGFRFTYTRDWSGFNVPLKVALRCKKVSKIETPYDEEMNKILCKISKKAKSNSYIVGVESIKSQTFMHELSHALYHTDKVYKSKMDSITSSLSVKEFKKLSSYLKKIGYCDAVIKDEIQAYLSTEKGIWGPARKEGISTKVINAYKNIFNKRYIELTRYKMD